MLSSSREAQPTFLQLNPVLSSLIPLLSSWRRRHPFLDFVVLAVKPESTGGVGTCGLSCCVFRCVVLFALRLLTRRRAHLTPSTSPLVLPLRRSLAPLSETPPCVLCGPPQKPFAAKSGRAPSRRCVQYTRRPHERKKSKAANTESGRGVTLFL